MRLQRINNRRLKSYLRFELKQCLPAPEACDAADCIAALIDGLWLHEALSPGRIDARRCERLIMHQLNAWLPNPTVETPCP